ncbi:hypothetical protein O3M35_000518 [Rhynocoris fuscipes]|uniref:Cell adhesion molecule-related/down-regulated by oncogenes n=1 Tax=Rhynocoris fuscipes TaxID=488301 RepID=A0AAW1DMJ2_9HEMI
MAHEFSENPENTTVYEGDLVRLKCSIDSTPAPSIQWYKNHKPLPHNKRFTPTVSGVLYITNAKPEDAGKYKCQATNTLAKKTRSSSECELIVVRVNGIPQTVKFLNGSPPSAVSLRQGREAYIACAASGIPRPTLKWVHTKYDGTNITLQTTSNGLNILNFNKVSTNNNGVYTCVATQTVKDKVTTATKVVNVDVEVPPEIVQKPKSQVYPAAKTVRFECDVRGNPQPHVTWFKDGIKLLINGRIKQRSKELILGGVVSQDTGIYQCFASNGGDTVAWGAGRLLVNTSIDQPLPPTSLSCTTVSPTEVSLTWRQYPPPVDLKAYSVHYFPTDGGDEGKEVALNESYVVQKLIPYTNYTFYIRSYSGRSASEQSQRVTCKTGEAVPTGGAAVKVIATGSQCLLVTWTPPSVSLARGAITHYKIQWKRSNQSSINFNVVPGDIYHFRINNLQCEQNYLVRVIGATSLGWPELSDSQAPWSNVTPTGIYNHKTPIPLAPNIRLSSINSSTILVEWRFEREVVVIDGFRLIYRKSETLVDSEVVLTNNTRSYYIVGLEPLTWYEVIVRTISGGVESVNCAESILTRDSDKANISSPPPEPNSIDAVPTIHNSINLTWTMAHRDLNLHQFSLKYYPLRSPNNTTTVNISGSERSYQVHGLKANTIYEFLLSSIGKDNQLSLRSANVECRTFADFINTVEDLKWKPLNNTSVQVWWKPIESPVLLHYIVYYSHEHNAPINSWQEEIIDKNTTSIVLSGLKINVRYMVKVRGVSGSGPGPPSPNLYFTIPVIVNNNKLPSPNGTPRKPNSNTSSDQLLGIVVGCSISACCVALCTGSLLYRRKCAKYQGQIPSSNGNGQCSTQHEMQTLTHRDPKGINHPNGQMNGIKFPLLYNGAVPNGHVREKAVRITENPQLEDTGHDLEDSDLLHTQSIDGQPITDETQVTLLETTYSLRGMPI